MNVLIADDDPNDITLLARCLRKAGLEKPAQVVANGEEVIRYLEGASPFNDRQKFPLPDVVILDSRMHGAGGVDILEWLAERPQWASVSPIVLAGAQPPADVRRAYELGARAVFRKPQQIEALEQLARVILEYWSRAERPQCAAPCHPHAAGSPGGRSGHLSSGSRDPLS